MVNRLDLPLTSLGLVPRQFEIDTELALARRSAGLDDFGDAHFLAPLGKLLEAYNLDARLTLIGRLAVRTYLQQLLTNRLYLQEDRKRHPAIEEEEIERPIFVLGLPRTGSTLLFELLAQDTALRTPLSWQVMFPSRQQGLERIRQRRSAHALGMLDWLSPGFRSIHPLGAMLPQECIAIQTHSFRSIQFHTSHRVTSYHHWLLEQCNWDQGYLEHRQFLQHLAHQIPQPNHRWLLKAPGHLFSLAALLKCYPDAQFIQTHRDPTEVVSSIASLSLKLRRAFCTQVDPHEIGREWAEAWAVGLQRTLDIRRENRSLDKAIVDLGFEDLMQHPIDCIKTIYRKLDRPLSAKILSRMQDYLATHPRNRFGVHAHALEDFGLDPRREHHRFEDYIKQHQDC